MTFDTTTRAHEHPASAHDKRWQSVVQRDATADGSFVDAVRTTGIYCRPSCPARRAQPQNVSFYATCEAAEAAGYRACQRCGPDVASRAAKCMRPSLSKPVA